MLKIDDILNNNSAEEGIYIVTYTEPQYRAFLGLLHIHGYTWRSGHSVINFTPDEITEMFKTEEQVPISIGLHEGKEITYMKLDENAYSFCFLSEEDIGYENPKPSILKPYITLDKELEKAI